MKKIFRWKGPVKYKEINKDLAFMTIQDWKNCCAAGGYIDYDGYGYLCTATQQSDIQIRPSESHKEISSIFTHINWVNR